MRCADHVARSRGLSGETRLTALHIDFETRGVLDLKEVGLHRYVNDPQTDVWCMAFSFGDTEPWLWHPGKKTEIEYLPHKHIESGGEVWAHNAPFELAVWNSIMVPRYGWPRLHPEQTHCTMAMCYAMGLPGALEDAALAVGLSVLKDAEGRGLMLRMARPRSIDKLGRPVWWDDADKLARLYAYCQQDVRVERELHKRLMPLSAQERKVWLLDYKINQRGVAIDMPTVHGAIKLTEDMKEQATAKLAAITGGAVLSPTALPALKAWMAEKGVKVDGLAKQDVIDLLESDTLTPRVAKALKIRQEGGKASTAKFAKMAAQVGADGRLRNMYQYHGAATGRWAGRGVQTSNLVRDMPPAETVEKVLHLIRTNQHDAIDAIYGSPLTMASRCMRSLFVAPPGKKLISGDWSNIEGRGQAWFAGEHWKLQAFVAADNKTGPGIYELAYSRMFGVPVESVKNPSEERQVGKVSELAFGYQGGVGSFHTMGRNYGVKVPDAKAAEFKDAWRAAHPKIKAVWKEIEKAAINAVRTPGEVYACGFAGRQAHFKMAGSFLWCKLPSGRVICFPYPKLLEGQYGPQLTYMTVPGQDKTKVIADPKNASNWARVATYGGSLFNNIVQGFCRDILAECMLALDAKGAAIVLHTYDDVNVEVDAAKADGACAEMKRMMLTPPAWAAGLPLFAKPKVMTRYGK